MTDYTTVTQIGRDQMADMLRDNEEQLIYVLSEALRGDVVDDAIELGSLPYDIDDPEKTLIVENMRKIANAIETGKVQ